MKQIITLLPVLLALWAFMQTEPRKKAVFFGDSITQAAVKPGGYIDVLGHRLRQKGKADQYELIGAGIGGNKVPDLQKRLEKDVLSQKPDLVFIYIGINDVWHFEHACCKDNGGGTPIAIFEAGLTDIIRQIKAQGAQVVLCTPSVIGEKHDASNPQDAMLNQYAAVSRKVAQATNSGICDLRKGFINYLKKHNRQNIEQGVLTSDRVHLNAAGNAFVAEQMEKFLK